MYHKLYRVVEFNVIQDYTIWMRFDDDQEQVIDFAPVLYGEMWRLLRDLSLFRQVQLDPIAYTLTWPNGADFDPETLHNWLDYVDELAARAQQWEQVPA